MTKFTARTLTSCVPICRSDLFEEVTQNAPNQPVRGVWVAPGHVFVTVGSGHKLLTFDCKPVTQHSVSSGTLDFPALKPAVLDILISPLSSNIAYIVQQNGRVHCWQFSSSYQWSSVSEFDLSEEGENCQVTAVCLHPKRHTLYWCEELCAGEEEEPLHRVCSKVLPHSVQEITDHSQRCEVILQDCPSAHLLPVDYGLLIVPRFREGQSRVSIFWQPSVLQMVSVVTIIGSTVRNHHDMRSPLLFSSVLLSTLSDLSQASSQGEDLGAKQDLTTGLTVLLHVDGTLQSFHVTESDLKQSLAVRCVKLSMPEAVLQTSDPGDAWNIHKDVVAIATAASTVRLYGAAEGHLLHEVQLGVGVSIHCLVHLRSPTLLLAALTSTGVTVVQGGRRSTGVTQEQRLPSNKHFQTDALQVALLVQQREERPSQQVSEQLSSLYRKWMSLQDQQPRSYLSDTVDGYLAEFWHLEEEASRLGKSQSCPDNAVYTAKEMVQKAVARAQVMAPDAAMMDLLGLSQKYPEEMLTALIGDLQVDKDKLTAEEQVVWQRTLGLESADSHAHTQHCSVTFELVCRLLYQQKPDVLVAFVRNAQTVSEQSVGVSAFIRRKHMLQYYVRALECLPDPSLSSSPQQAAFAKAHIILKGSTEQGGERALRFLLHHHCWTEAIVLLRHLGCSSSSSSSSSLPPHLSSLFSLLLQHLLQAEALSDYASEVFSLLPNWKSFLPALKVMGENSGSQTVMASPKLFYSGSPDIPLSAVQSHLMLLLNSRHQSGGQDGSNL